MSKVYVVIESGWEYNDEYYHRACDGASNVGKPTRVFTERPKAAARARELNIKEIKGTELRSYAGNGIEDLILDDKDKELSTLLFGKPDHDWGDWDPVSVPANITDEKAAEILDCLNISWFDIVEVELD